MELRPRSKFLHSCICDLYIPRLIGLPIWPQLNRQTDPGKGCFKYFFISSTGIQLLERNNDLVRHWRGNEPRRVTSAGTEWTPLRNDKIGIVAEKIDEIIIAENPPNCVGGICEFNCACLTVSRFVASLRNTSSSVNIVWELFPGPIEHFEGRITSVCTTVQYNLGAMSFTEINLISSIVQKINAYASCKEIIQCWIHSNALANVLNASSYNYAECNGGGWGCVERVLGSST